MTSVDKQIKKSLPVNVAYRKPVLYVKGIMTGGRPVWNGSIQKESVYFLSSGFSGRQVFKTLEKFLLT